MKITLEPTATIQDVNGEPARVWTGHDDQGVPIVAHIRLVSPQTHDEAIAARYGAELRDVGFARATPITIDTRLVQ
jgi:hypothetical protein